MAQGSGDANEDRPKFLKEDDSMTGEIEKPNTKVLRGANERRRTVVNNVYDLLECPVCFTLMSPPIYQCPNGHTLCSICKIGVQSCCPICRVDMGTIRCLALEKVAQPLGIPYRSRHNASECSITGSIPELEDYHKFHMHVVIKYGQCYAQYSDFHEIKSAKGKSHIFFCYGQTFCYQFQAFLTGMFPCYIALLRLISKNTKGKKFRYSLKVCGNDRQLSWKGAPKSNCDNQQKVDGLVIPWNLAFFSNGHEQQLKLKLHGRLWIEQ